MNIKSKKYAIYDSLTTHISYLTSYIFLIFCFLFAITNVNAAYLKDIPVKVVQSNGDTLHCLASGDEFFNYLHDENGFTIIQNDEGYYMYAMYDGENIIPSQFMAGTVNPAAVGLQPNVTISTQEYQKRRAAWFNYEDISRSKSPNRNHGLLNNLVVFIRFADDADIPIPLSTFDNMFNNQTAGYNSMINYFQTTSYGQITIPSHFFPEPDGDLILSYQDVKPRGYYQPYNATSNPIGYQGGNNGDERTEREHLLLRKAIEFIADMVPEDLDIDYDNDDYVDNVCFIVKGESYGWNDILWPHRWALYNEYAAIHGKRVWDFNFQQAEGYFNIAVLCHEMQHTLSYPDLYHYANGGPSAVGNWDIMESNPNPPQQSGAYMKWKYGNWLPEPVEISSGEYTLNSIGSGTENTSYKIPTDDPQQFFVLEYRNSNDPFENFDYGNVAGMLIYRINTRWDGNAGYNPAAGIYDEVYLFRPGGNNPNQDGNLNIAHFGPNGRTQFDAHSNPKPFLTNGTYITDLSITNITVNGNEVSFKYEKILPPVYYTITASAEVLITLKNDIITIEPEGIISVLENTDKTFIIKSEGYPIARVEVDGYDYYPQTEEENYYMEYTFENVTANHYITAFTIIPGAIDEHSKTNLLFTIHPNPANNYLEIVLSNEALTMQGLSAQFFNIQGALLKTLPLNNEKTQIDISDLAKGFYVIKVGYEAKKLIVR